MKKVCVITTAHPAGDNRIFYREIGSLLKKYEVFYITTQGKVEAKGSLQVGYIGGWGNRLQRLKGNFSAFKMARKSRADIFHFHDPEFVPFALTLKWLTGKPVIYDIHEDYPAVVMGRAWIPRYLRPVVSRFTSLGERACLGHLSHLIVASEGIKERYQALNNKCMLLNNFPEQGIINKFYKVEKDSRIVCLGNLNEIRGARVVIGALGELLKDNRHTFCLIGDIKPESLKRELLEKIEPNIRRKIEITGLFLDYKKAIQVASSGSVGLLSYLDVPNHRVASPNKIYEYMGMGLAILCTDLPNYSKVVEGNGTGLSYFANSQNDLVDKMRKIFNSDKALEQMQMNGRKLFLEKYNWSVEERKLFKLYKELLG